VSTFQEENHLKVLRLLAGNSSLNQRELAKALGVSLGKTNYCLRALIEKGLVKVRNFRGSQNKMAYAYLLTPLGIAEKAHLTARFLKRKLAEYESLKVEIHAMRCELNSSAERTDSTDGA
jgi:EPS-associated MarR family transcriptional regulator